MCQSRDSSAGGGCGARHVVAGNHARAETNRLCRIVRHGFDMDTDTVSDCEPDMPPVEHGYHLLFIPGSAQLHGGALLEDRRTLGRLDHQLWLKNPGLIAPPFGFALLIDQEQRYHPEVTCAAHTPAHYNIGLLIRLRAPGSYRALLQGKDMRFSLNWLSLPHQFRSAFGRLEHLAWDAPVVAPARCNAQTGRAAGNAETQANRGGVERSRLQRRSIVQAVFAATFFRNRQFFQLFWNDLLIAGRERANQVAVTHTGFIQFFPWAASWSEQFQQYQPFKLIA